MDRKEEHAMALQSAQARAAKQEYILKGPRSETHSATMPAYCYTAMCPDPAPLEEAQTSTEYQGREGRKDLPDLPEAMAGGMRP